MELPENKSQLVKEAANRSTRPIKLTVILVITCAQIVFAVVPCILGIIKNRLDFKLAEFVIVFFFYESITFAPLVLTYFRFKNAYKECYSKDFCPTDILKYIDKQRRIFVIVNICRSVLLFGFLPEFPFDWIIQYLSGDFDMDSDLTEQYIKVALVSMTILIVLFFIFGTFVDLLVFWLLLGKVGRPEKKPDPCIRCGNTIEVDVTNLYCRDCEKLRKEVEKAHFLPNPQQKVLISSYTQLQPDGKNATFTKHVVTLSDAGVWSCAVSTRAHGNAAENIYA
ncbi:hypothetical protein Ddc_15167 [Ditylenchus destructor]|nr:hypothetical protein Ddc_15167 [Ditylenchus destructor]